jgi:hypothetical protein
MAVQRALNRLKYRYKTLHVDEQEREDRRLLREQWLKELLLLDPDQTGIRLYGGHPIRS